MSIYLGVSAIVRPLPAFALLPVTGCEFRIPRGRHGLILVDPSGPRSLARARSPSLSESGWDGVGEGVGAFPGSRLASFVQHAQQECFFFT